ncbi:hypothetical protein CFBP7900_29800 [Xanthomonas hortorum pv. carotae]|uniref:Uncharacterized protein n=1 Tax=Xanthomonas hortorum pv. carotae TaxID=487904 RepID=A0A6V7F370_9XANT|nr:hypothetical protein CFBP7900_29800 [Xanthomonas hortorum pv. carotae]CAD0357943.1 hypothetical protein CFBP7900_29800 [Xanthomonas hortorum pv. carotae]
MPHDLHTRTYAQTQRWSASSLPARIADAIAIAVAACRASMLAASDAGQRQLPHRVRGAA